LKIFLLLTFIIINTLFAQSAEEQKEPFEPLIQRYILDELKEIRIDHHKLRADTEKRISRAEVENTDRSARYITDTVGNIFYIIAAATSILIFSGWNSLRDIRKKTEETIEIKIDKITKRYNQELESLQEKLREQSEKIIINQNKIYSTQLIHSLWMRANLETNPQAKIDIFDEILALNSNDAEVYAYKADAVLDLDEYEWALNLSNKAIQIDKDYGYAYWQRACANAKLNNLNEAISDLEIALTKSQNLKDEVESESSFETIKDTPEFQEMIEKYTT
jgi:tetratricopeptide (TPR) repeat protein